MQNLTFHLVGVSVLHLLLLLGALLDGRLVGLDNGDGAFLITRNGQPGSGQLKHSVRRQVASQRLLVHVVRQLVAAAELPRDEPVFVRAFLVLALNAEEIINNLKQISD